MITAISEIGIICREYDEARDWYINVLGFELAEDTDMGDGRRWVTVTPPGTKNVRIVFTKAATPEQIQGVGKQGFGKVIFFLNTDDFAGDYKRLVARGVKFFGGVRDAPYGKVTIFEDLYGNRWDMIQPTKSMLKQQRQGL